MQEGASNSLQLSLAIFFVGVTAEKINNEGNPELRSMLIHPSHLKDSHSVYTTVIDCIHSH